MARISAGAVTEIQFVVRAEFGLAGRLTTADGEHLTRVRVELVDLEGNRVASATTNRFGLYRLDGVPIGTYQLRIAPDSLPRAGELPIREIEIRDSFLFGQDLVLPDDESPPI